MSCTEELTVLCQVCKKYHCLCHVQKNWLFYARCVRNTSVYAMYRRIDCFMPGVYETPLVMSCTEELTFVCHVRTKHHCICHVQKNWLCYAMYRRNSCFYARCVQNTTVYAMYRRNTCFYAMCVRNTTLQKKYLCYAMHVNTISSMPVCKKYLFGVQSHTF
jgi:3-phenylpropionate/cinnamic acid dioxygenase small subunit